jgi:ABC-type amino acid transport substrate-binding protein
MTRRRALPLALMLALGAVPGLAQEADRALQIGTTTAPPFAMRGANGQWDGLSIALLADVAGRAGLRYDLVETDAAGLIDGVATGKLDASIAAIVPTPTAERSVDFSNSYFQSGLAVAVPSVGPVSVLDLLKALASREFRGVLAVLLGLTVVVGALAWLAERRKNPEFERRPTRGLFSGFWWATVTMTTVGYGDKAPVTVTGRLLAIVWMILALGLVALATAQLSAILTADRLSGGLGTVGELTRMRVGAVADGPAIGPLGALGVQPQTFPSVPEGLRALGAGKIDAFVDDEAELAWETGLIGDIALARVRFGPESYAMALPPGSALREPINRAILDTLGSPEWLATLRYYLASD